MSKEALEIFSAILGVVIVVILICVAVSIFSTCKGDTKPQKSGWSITEDLTPDTRDITTKILTDPNGQKFLIIKNNGVAIIPYKKSE